MAHLSHVETYRGMTLPALRLGTSLALGLAFFAGSTWRADLKAAARPPGAAERARRHLVPRDWMPGRLRSSATLACDVSRRVMRGQSAISAGQVTGLIYCHNAASEQIYASTPGRIQNELELKQARSFSVSQCHNVSVFAALDLALGMIEGPDQAEAILISASDKMLFPTQRPGRGKHVFGDNAAAMLVSRSSTQGWRLLDSGMVNCAADGTAPEHWDGSRINAFALKAASAARAMLAKSGLSPADLDTSMASGAAPQLAAAFDAALGLPLASRAARPGTLASAVDPLLAIAALPPGGPHCALIWGAGNNGEFGCCILARQ